MYRRERWGNGAAAHFWTLLTLLSSWHFLSSAGVLGNGELNTYLPVGAHLQLYQALSIRCTRMIQEVISEQKIISVKSYLFFLHGRADRRKKTFPSQFQGNKLMETAHIQQQKWYWSAGAQSCTCYMAGASEDTREVVHMNSLYRLVSPWVPFKFLAHLHQDHRIRII